MKFRSLSGTLLKQPAESGSSSLGTISSEWITTCRGKILIKRAIAAGLAMKLLVTFETSNLEEYHDSMKIVSDGGFSFDVNLNAYPP